MCAVQKIRPREKDAILQSIRAGVVPKIGLHHIQVGRANEVKELVEDINRISDGGSTIRFIIGEYGAGKTFFLHLIRTIAHEKGVITCHADLHPTRRIHASGGQAKELYSELLRNISTRSKPDGGAIISIVERFISKAREIAENKNHSVEIVINGYFKELQELVGGYDFAEVIKAYWRGFENDNDQLKSDAIRWLRAEFSTKTDARLALGVRNIVDDSNAYDFLKLLAKFIRIAGYNGLMVCYDEMVNLYKLNNAQARKSNYEQILRILNDSLQGISEGIGFLMLGTPDFLMDSRRGLYSYDALQTRLAENTFAKAAGVQDFSGPVIRLANLKPEDIFVLLKNITNVFMSGNGTELKVDDRTIEEFLMHCSKNIGDAYFRTPRNTIKAYTDLLTILQNHPNINWESLLGGVTIAQDVDMDKIEEEWIDENKGETQTIDNGSDEDDLSTFKL